MGNDYSTIKKELLKVLVARTEERIAMIDAALETARDSSNDDTKSSAGDKYETSREMIQQDINRYQKQLLEANKDLQQLAAISSMLDENNEHARLGSLVQTNAGFYFIAVSVGALKIGDTGVFVISPVSPIGQILLAKKRGDTFVFNKNEQHIISIY